MALTLAIFCKVVDNYGDIGICWRLARQLHDEHGVAVTLWVDDLASFRRICPEIDVASPRQFVAGIDVRHWQGQAGAYEAADVPDVVIEFFGVELPPGYVAAMAARQPRPVWINYEGLSAEAWVEGCHRLPSMHPRLKLTKHFFFPGYTDKTGGLLRERGLLAARDRFQADAGARAAFFGGLGVTQAEMDAHSVSLFCYPHAPVAPLFEAWAGGTAPLTCLVPEGVAREQVGAFLGAAPAAGSVAVRGMLTVRVIPFLPQPDYDRLLWACDTNFVRGEDSWVRAQWAGRPFVWHIYPEDENLHHVKLRAFLAQYAPDVPGLAEFALCWNGAGGMENAGAGWPDLWALLQAERPAIARRNAEWQARMLANGDLVGNFLDFIGTLR
jgi:uncharacterized repeat protein (TIGR03837 family)